MKENLQVYLNSFEEKLDNVVDTLETTTIGQKLKMAKRGARRLSALALTFLMIFTCWVFTPPTEAEAALGQGTYYFKVYAYCQTEFANDDTNCVYFQSLNSDGSYTTYLTVDISDSLLENDHEGTGLSYETTTTIFPDRIQMRSQQDDPGCFDDAVQAVWTVSVYAYNTDFTNADYDSVTTNINSSAQPTDPQGTLIVDALQINSSTTGSAVTNQTNPTAPYANSVTATTTTLSTTIPKVGESVNNEVTTTYIAYDQYNVTVPATYTLTTIEYDSDTVYSTFTDYSTSTATDSVVTRTFNIDSGDLIDGPDNQNEIVTTYNFTFGTKTVTGTTSFKINDPQYSISYSANNNSDYELTNGSLDFDSRSTTYGDYLTESQIPDGTISNATLIGYYDVANDPQFETIALEGNLLQAGITEIDEEITWYAAWQTDTYLASFKSWDGQYLDEDVTVYWYSSADETATSTAAMDELESSGVLDRESTDTFTYTFDGWVVDQAWDKNGDEIDFDGETIKLEDYTIVGDVTYRASYTTSVGSYTANFVDEDGETVDPLADGTVFENLPYGEVISTGAVADQDDYQSNTIDYTFAGWVSAAVYDDFTDTNSVYGDSTTAIYATTAEIAQLESTNKLNNLKVTGDMTFIPVYEVTTRTYDVTFSYQNAAGDVTTDVVAYEYDEVIAFPDSYETSYVDVENETASKYDVTSWTNEDDAEFIDVSDITVSSMHNDETSVNENQDYTFTATYESATAEFTVTFVDADGNELQSVEGYEYGDPVTAPNDVASYIIDDYKYVFSGWDKEVTDVTGDVVYTAQYTPLELFDVTFEYRDGTETTIQVADGEIFEDGLYTDEMDTDNTYSYVFSHWTVKDEDVEDEHIYGAKVEAITEDTTLVAAFTPTYVEYTVTFLDEDGDPDNALQTGTYHYGDVIEIETPTKESDIYYDYTFAGWSPEFTGYCLGDDTFIATYTAKEILYDITWLNDDGETVVYETKAPYDTPVFYWQPLNPTSTEAAETGYTYRFSHWEYTVGNETFELEAGQYTTGVMTFTAVYEKVAVDYTVTFKDADGSTTLVDFGMTYDASLEGVGFSYVPATICDAEDMEYHQVFAYWSTSVGGTEFDMDTVLSENTTLYAVYKSEAHSFDVEIVTTSPTFTSVGSKTLVCSCGCEKVETIDKLEDTIAPTITATFDDVEWVETETTTKEVADDTIVSIFIKDTAKDGEYNVNGYGSGIESISFACVQNDTEVDSIEYYDVEDLVEYGSNSITLTSYLQYLYDFEIASDEEFYITIKAVDANGNESTYTTGNLIFDYEACDISLNSETTHTGLTTEFCLDVTATIENFDDLKVVTLNGVDITEQIIENTENNTGSITFDEAGTYTLVTSDNVGNTAVKIFYITGSHNEVEANVAATCTETGYNRTVCADCGAIIEEKETDKIGHDYEITDVIEGNCSTKKITTYTCKNCGDSYEEKDDVDYSNVHVYDDGVETGATCTADGYITYTCTNPVCGYSYTEAGDKATGHYDSYWVIDTAATCTEDGERYKYCTVCSEETAREIIPATDHAYKYFVTTTEATCTTAGVGYYYCDECLTKVEENVVIPATDHSWGKNYVVTNDDGSQEYWHECETCGATEWVSDITTEGGDEGETLEKFTITVLNEDGSQADTIEKFDTEYITKADVPNPTKTSTNYYSYTFSHWVDEDGNTIELPYQITGDLELTPVFTEKAVTFSVVFRNEDGSLLGGGTYEYGYTLTDSQIPAPTKASDGDFEYTFVGWTPEFSSTVTGNVTYTAQFTSSAKTYTIVFVYDDLTLIESFEVTYGSKVTAPTITAKDSDNDYEYYFDGWSADESVWEYVTKDAVIKANFTKVAHVYTVTNTYATCTEAAVKTYTCTNPDCDHSYEVSYGSANGHDFTVTEQVNATHYSQGYMVETCLDCGFTQTTILDVLDYIAVELELNYIDHSAANNVKIEIFYDTEYITTVTTDLNGTVSLELEYTGRYDIVLYSDNFETTYGQIIVAEDGTYTLEGVSLVYGNNCDCTCHKDTVWASIFRFFHGIIASFAGEPICCECPDSRY